MDVTLVMCFEDYFGLLSEKLSPNSSKITFCDSCIDLVGVIGGNMLVLSY